MIDVAIQSLALAMDWAYTTLTAGTLDSSPDCAFLALLMAGVYINMLSNPTK